MFKLSRRRLFSSIPIGTLTLLGLTLATAGASPMSPDFGDAPIIQTSEGPVQGFATKGITEHLGIPYATPPVGDLRWLPPIPHAPWTKVLQATSFASNCPQIAATPFAGPTSENEDCLYLNIFRAEADHRKKLPVIVWIHGGGNTSGESSDYDGSKLAAQGRTVVVTIDYRVGLLGFMANPAIDAEGHLFANYGILDQQVALKWVKHNIAEFGGDPNNVTLAGQSAGSVDTEANVISPLAKGLFQKAIFQSDLVESSPLADAEKNGTAFAVAAGCGSDATPETAKCLRNLTVDQILAMQGPYAVLPLGIVADGQILPAERFTTLIAAGRFNHVPIISGTTEDELENFILAIQEYLKSPPAPFTAKDYMTYVNSLTGSEASPVGYGLGTFPAGTPEAVMIRYPLNAYPTPQLAMDAIGTDAITCEQRHHNRLFASQVPVYTYEFDDRTAPSYFPPLPGFLFLSAHTADLQYYWPLFHGRPSGIPHPLNAQQEFLSDELVAAWTNFAWTGNPNLTGNWAWPVYRPSQANALILSEGLWTPQPKEISGITLPKPSPASHPPGLSTFTDAAFKNYHHCDFWDSILSY